MLFNNWKKTKLLANLACLGKKKLKKCIISWCIFDKRLIVVICTKTIKKNGQWNNQVIQKDTSLKNKKKNSNMINTDIYNWKNMFIWRSFIILKIMWVYNFTFIKSRKKYVKWFFKEI